MADDWGSFGTLVSPASPSPQPTQQPAPSAQAHDDWDSVGTMVSPAPAQAQAAPAPAMAAPMKGVDRSSKGYAAALAHEQALDQRFNQEPDEATAAGHRAAGQMETFNFSDELEGRAAQGRAWLEQHLLGYKEPYTPEEAYQARVDLTRRQLAEDQQKHPGMVAFGTGAGMVTQAVGAEGVLGAAANALRGGEAAAQAAQPVSQFGKIANATGRVAKHAVVGAGYNVAAGVGARAGNDRDNVGDMVSDAEAGGVLGGGLGLLGEGLGALGRWRASKRVMTGASSPLPGSEAEAALNAGGFQPGPSSPLAARFSDQAARAQAGDQLLAAASNPTKFANDLYGPDGRLIPNSNPTTFQLTGDLGVGQAERTDRVRNQADYQDFDAQNNAARTNVLRPIAENGDPNALAISLRSGMAQLDAAEDARARGLQANAQGQAALIGGDVDPTDRGTDIRDQIGQSAQAERQAARKFYDLAYEGNPTGNVTETRDAARKILDGLTEVDRKTLDPTEQMLLVHAANLSPVTPLRELDSLKSNISKVMRGEANDRSPTWGRMSQLRDAIHSNLANSISQRIVDQEVMADRGEIPQEQTLGARMEQAMTGTDNASARPAAPVAPVAAPAIGDMDPMALSHVGQAQRDVADFRAGPGPMNSLFGAMVDLGGLKLKDRNGVKFQGAPEAENLLDGIKRPGLVTREGLTPDGMRRALSQAGWLEGTRGGGANIQDLLDLMGREARGNTVFHPASDMPAKLARQQALEEEMTAAGVGPKDRRDAAARKLAVYRASQQLQAAQAERALTALKMRADELGIPVREGAPYGEILGDVLEREAIQSEGLSDHMLAAREHLLQEQLTPDELQRHLDHAEGGAAAQPEGAGFVPNPAAGGEDAGGQGAAGASGAGAGGAGADAGAPGAGVGGEPRQGVAQPTITDEQADALKQGSEAWRRYKERFGTGPVAQVLRKEGGTVFARPAGAVGSTFFVKGDAGFDRMNALRDILPEDQFNALMADQAAHSLREAAERDGVIDPKRFAKWRDDHAQALRALPPEVQQSFSNAADATQAMEEAAAARKQRMDAAQEGKLGDIMGLHSGEDVRNTVGRALTSPDAVAQLTAIRNAVQHDPDAIQGLRRALVDHILNKVSSSMEAGTSGVDQLKADALVRLVREREQALRVVFSPEEVQNMKNVAADLQRAGRSVNATKMAGSPGTAQDAWSLAKDAARKGALHLALAKIPGAGPLAAKVIDAVGSRGVQRVDQLVHEALMNPELARQLVGAAQGRADRGGVGARYIAGNTYQPGAIVRALDRKAGSIGGRAAALGRGPR